MRNRDFRKVTLARSVIFFFDVFLALTIIAGSYFLIKSQAGKFAMLFGFFMFVLSVILRVLKQW